MVAEFERMSAAKTPEKKGAKMAPPKNPQPSVKPSTLLSASDRRKLRTPKVLEAASSKEQVRAVTELGERLRLAREMNGWEVSEAARRLGFENAGSLSRFEHAKHVSAIPLYIIPRAAQVYGVSTDYLHGLTDDLSIAPALRMRRDVAVWLSNEMERQRQRDIDAMLLLQEQIELVFSGAREVTLVVEELCAAVDYLRARNVVKFENMPGSNAVMVKSQRALSAATTTSARLARFSSMLRASGVRAYAVESARQMPLELGRAGGI